MDSKLLLGASAAAALIGLIYFLTREVDVDEPASKSPPKPSARQPPKGQTAVKSPPPRPQTKAKPPAPAEEHALRRSMTVAEQPPRPDSGPNELIQYDQGVITTDSLVMVLRTIKEKYVEYVESLTANFKAERRAKLKEDPAEYRAIVLRFRSEQQNGLEGVFSKTLSSFKVSQDDIAKYNKRHGNSLFYSHMERMMMPAAKQTPVTLTLEALIEVLEEKVRLLGEKLGAMPKVAQEDLLVTGFMIEDLLAEKYGKEEDEVSAAIAKYKSDPGVLEAMQKINAFKPR